MLWHRHPLQSMRICSTVFCAQHLPQKLLSKTISKGIQLHHSPPHQGHLHPISPPSWPVPPPVHLILPLTQPTLSRPQKSCRSRLFSHFFLLTCPQRLCNSHAQVKSHLPLGRREKTIPLSFPPPLDLSHYCSQGIQFVDIRAYQLLAELLQNPRVGLRPCAGAGGNTEGFHSAPGFPQVKSNLHC